MDDEERKNRQAFQRKIFHLQTKQSELQEKIAQVNKEMADLWLLNDKILNGEYENGMVKGTHS